MTSSAFSNLARSTSASRKIGAINSGMATPLFALRGNTIKLSGSEFGWPPPNNVRTSFTEYSPTDLEVPPPASPNRNPQAAPVLIRIARPISPSRTRPLTCKAVLSAA